MRPQQCRQKSYWDSARKALAEELPDLAALRIESVLKKEKNLSAAEKQQSYLLLGEAHIRAGNAAKALAALAKAPDASDERLNFWQGLALARQEKYSAALKKLAQVSESNELFPQALFNIVEIEEQLGNHEEALAALARIRQANPAFQTHTLALT